MQNTQPSEDPVFQTPDPSKNKKTSAESLIEEGVLDPSLDDSKTNAENHDRDRSTDPDSQVINTNISAG